jgi:hypothetical protein
MTAIQIRDLPEATRQVLIRAAAARDESLQVYLSEVLEQEARRVQNRDLVSSYAANRRGGTRTNPAELIREGREERQQHITDAIQPGRD